MVAPIPSQSSVQITTATLQIAIAQLPPMQSSETLSQAVHRLALKYNQDETLINRLIECESGGKQSARNYNTVVGVDVGVFQINTFFHQSRAESLGYNIYTLEGNLAYGFVLLKEQGTTPWNWSKFCWQG